MQNVIQCHLIVSWAHDTHRDDNDLHRAGDDDEHGANPGTLQVTDDDETGEHRAELAPGLYEPDAVHNYAW